MLSYGKLLQRALESLHYEHTLTRAELTKLNGLVASHDQLISATLLHAQSTDLNLDGLDSPRERKEDTAEMEKELARFAEENQKLSVALSTAQEQVKVEVAKQQQAALELAAARAQIGRLESVLKEQGEQRGAYVEATDD